MRKTISNIVMALLLFFLSLIFFGPLFAGTLLCAADNNKMYKYETEKDSKGRFEETFNWVKGPRTGLTQKLVVKDINKTNPSDDYLQLTDGKYTITYSLRCVYE